MVNLDGINVVVMEDGQLLLTPTEDNPDKRYIMCRIGWPVELDNGEIEVRVVFQPIQSLAHIKVDISTDNPCRNVMLDDYRRGNWSS